MNVPYGRARAMPYACRSPKLTDVPGRSLRAARIAGRLAPPRPGTSVWSNAAPDAASAPRPPGHAPDDGSIRQRWAHAARDGGRPRASGRRARPLGPDARPAAARLRRSPPAGARQRARRGRPARRIADAGGRGGRTLGDRVVRSHRPRDRRLGTVGADSGHRSARHDLFPRRVLDRRARWRRGDSGDRPGSLPRRRVDPLVSLLETLVALVILGLAGVGFL